MALRHGLVVVLGSSFALLQAGCASLNAELQGLNYPADTAILIDDVPYQINTIKCAEIKSIKENGALDCYDAEGQQSASIPPVSERRRNSVKKNFGVDWASPEHQDVLFNFFHEGGAEALAGAIVGSVQQSYSTIAATKDLIDTIDKSAEMDQKSAQTKMDGTRAYMAGGSPAWQAHQSNVIQWHLDNARYFQGEIPN